MLQMEKKLNNKILALVVALLVTFALAGIAYIPASAEGNEITGGASITENGTYTLADGATGMITVSGGLTDVKIEGHSYDAETNSFSNPYLDLNIVVGDNTKLTIKDIYADVQEDANSIIDFQGKGTLYITGHNLLDRPNGYGAKSTIHVGPDADVTFDGDGYLWGYKHAAGSFIGSDKGEKCGNITFDGGTYLLKASKTGALIGQDSSEAATGKIIINGGTIYLKAVARGSLLGASAQGQAPDVVVNGGQLELVSDFSGAAIGSITPTKAGKLTVNGGSIRTIVTRNAYDSWGIDADTHIGAVLTDVNITAEHETAMLAFDASPYASAETINVYLDDETEKPFYSGGLYEFCTNEIKNPEGTVNNWLPNTTEYALNKDTEYIQGGSSYDPVVEGSQLAGDNTLVFHLTKEDHVLTVNGNVYHAYWNEEKDSFDLSQNSCTYSYGDKSCVIYDYEIEALGTEKTLIMNGEPKKAVYTKLTDILKEKGIQADPTCNVMIHAVGKQGQNDDQYFAVSDELYLYVAGSIRTAVDNGPGWKWWKGVLSIEAHDHEYENGFCVNKIGTGKDGATKNCSAADPDVEVYEISEPAQLAAIAEAVNGGDDLAGKEVDLVNDINLDGYTNWTPIGGAGGAFAGTFNGNGFTISGLTVDGSSSYTGLFGNNAGEINDFTLNGTVTVSGGVDFVGAVAGFNSGTITGVTSTATVTAGSAYNVGGIAGLSSSGIWVTGSGAAARVDDATGTISNCAVDATITGMNKVGGIVGENAGVIQNCSSRGKVDGTNASSKNGVGGIAGRNGCNNSAIETGTIDSCYSLAEVGRGGQKWVGGIAGFCNGSYGLSKDAETGLYYFMYNGEKVLKEELSGITNSYFAGSFASYNSNTNNPICGNCESNADYIYNNYSLSTLPASGSKEIEVGIRKDEADMKLIEFVDDLGEEFTSNCNGYPVLWFEDAIEHSFVNGTCEVCGFYDPWQEDEDGNWHYYDEEGNETSGWKRIDGDWYYFDSETGVMATGWTKVNNAWYYMDQSGVMQTGWFQQGSSWYYLKSNGVMATGWQEVGSSWYYFKSNGVMATGWQKVGSSWYYLKSNGVMVTGWQKIGGSWYYFKSSGVMAIGWQKIGSSWYYLKSNGVMATGWLKDGGSWYYLKSSGVMATGWQKISGHWYYFKSNGVMATGVVYIDGKNYIFGTTTGVWMG